MVQWNAQDYDRQLSRGLELSGEDASYFARRRVQVLATRCADAGSRPAAIVEFGCGTGNNLAFLRRAFPDAALCGLDSSPDMVMAARDRFPADERIRVCDVADLGEADVFDLVFLNGVMHHVTPADRPQVVSRLEQLLRPGGRLCIFDNNPLNPGAMWVMRRIEFDRDAQPVAPWTLARLVRATGLVEVEVTTHFYFPRVLSALRPAEPWLAALPFGAQYAVHARKAP